MNKNIIPVTISGLIIYGSMAWVFIWDNANKLTMANAFGVQVKSGLIFDFLPNETKYLEAIILVLLFCFVLVNYNIFNRGYKFQYLSYLLIAVAAATVSHLCNSMISDSVDFKASHMLYKTYRPLLLFVVIYHFSNNPIKNIVRVNWLFMGFVFINLAIATYQTSVYAYGVDLVTGFMRSAHTLGMTLLFFIVFLFFYINERKDLRTFTLVIPCFIFSAIIFIYTSNVKLVVLLFISVIFYAIMEAKVNNLKVILWSLIVSVFFLVSFTFLINFFGIRGFERLSDTWSYPLLKYPIVKSIYYLPKIFSENYFAPFFIGFGHGFFEELDIITPSLNDLQARDIIYYKYLELFNYLKVNRYQLTMIPTTMLLVPFSSALEILYGEGLIAFGFYIFLFRKIYLKLKGIKSDESIALPKSYIDTIIFLYLCSVLHFFIIPGARLISNIVYTFPLIINIALLFKYQDAGGKHNREVNI